MIPKSKQDYIEHFMDLNPQFRTFIDSSKVSEDILLKAQYSYIGESDTFLKYVNLYRLSGGSWANYPSLSAGFITGKIDERYTSLKIPSPNFKKIYGKSILNPVLVQNYYVGYDREPFVIDSTPYKSYDPPSWNNQSLFSPPFPSEYCLIKNTKFDFYPNSAYPYGIRCDYSLLSPTEIRPLGSDKILSRINPYDEEKLSVGDLFKDTIKEYTKQEIENSVLFNQPLNIEIVNDVPELLPPDWKSCPTTLKKVVIAMTYVKNIMKDWDPNEKLYFGSNLKEYSVREFIAMYGKKLVPVSFNTKGLFRANFTSWYYDEEDNLLTQGQIKNKEKVYKAIKNNHHYGVISPSYKMEEAGNSPVIVVDEEDFLRQWAPILYGYSEEYFTKHIPWNAPSEEIPNELENYKSNVNSHYRLEIDGYNFPFLDRNSGISYDYFLPRKIINIPDGITPGFLFKFYNYRYPTGGIGKGYEYLVYNNENFLPLMDINYSQNSEAFSEVIDKSCNLHFYYEDTPLSERIIYSTKEVFLIKDKDVNEYAGFIMYDQAELENFLREFGIQFRYLWGDVDPLAPDEEDGKKVRHTNRDTNCEFTKVRHKNKDSIVEVKKERRALNG